MAEYERVADDFLAALVKGTPVDEALVDARTELKRLGFDPDEIAEHLDVLKSDAGVDA